MISIKDDVCSDQIAGTHKLSLHFVVRPGLSIFQCRDLNPFMLDTFFYTSALLAGPFPKEGMCVYFFLLLITLLTASRPLFLKSSFRKSRVGVSSGETV